MLIISEKILPNKNISEALRLNPSLWKDMMKSMIWVSVYFLILVFNLIFFLYCFMVHACMCMYVWCVCLYVCTNAGTCRGHLQVEDSFRYCSSSSTMFEAWFLWLFPTAHMRLWPMIQPGFSCFCLPRHYRSARSTDICYHNAPCFTWVLGIWT